MKEREGKGRVETRSIVYMKVSNERGLSKANQYVGEPVVWTSVC